MNVSMVLPVYNEEKSIGECITKSRKVLDRLADKYEIIIVNDGSTDGTSKIIEKLHDGKIVVINHPTNKGYSSSLKDGFSNARYELIAYTDSDNQFNVEELSELMKFIDTYDMVIGYRINRQDPLHRLIVARTYGISLWLMFGLYVRDVDCAFKLFRRGILDKIRLNSEGYLISAEFLIKARKNHFKIKEVGVHHYPRRYGKSKVRVKDIIQVTVNLIRLKLELM